jgi:VWFA-related protein
MYPGAEEMIWHARWSRLTAVLLTIIAAAISGAGQTQVAPGRQVTIPVTVHPHNQAMREAAARLQPTDFVVREDERPEQILSVEGANEGLPELVVVLQDDLAPRVNNELSGLQSFIRSLPQGSHVMTAYITVGSLNVTQEFTTDRERAAGSLRIVRGNEASAPFSPYEELLDVLRRFDSQPPGRRIVFLVSDGLDLSRGFSSTGPGRSVDLDRAIRGAQRRGIAVFAFYAPTVGLTAVDRLATNFGQGSLNRLGDETGGLGFFSGTDFVTFDPYFKELRDVLGREWIITYRSTNTSSGFRRIKVMTESNVHLHYPAGYDSGR